MFKTFVALLSRHASYNYYYVYRQIGRNKIRVPSIQANNAGRGKKLFASPVRLYWLEGP